MSYIRHKSKSNKINDLALYSILWERIFPYDEVLLRCNLTFSTIRNGPTGM